MTKDIDRREFLSLMGMGGVVFMSQLSGTAGLANAFGQTREDFFFVQLSDSHWGFQGAKINPDFKGTLPKAVQEVNRLERKPDFIVFTGDLTDITDDTNERKKRMKEFQSIIGELDTKVIHFMPGEHDASLDNGETYKDFFGKTHYTFDHKGVHFITLDNVSDPTVSLGEEQLEWLKNDLAGLKPDQDIVVFTHRPLFDLYPEWDWWTKDGQKAIDLLMPFKNVSVFYGHIHNETHTMTGHIAHHSAQTLMIPKPHKPEDGSHPKLVPIPWDPAQPYKGMGFREIQGKPKPFKMALTEYPIKDDATAWRTTDSI